MYRERMNGYYPEVIRKITEFNAIIDGEYPEVEQLHEVNSNNLSDAYLTTMGEERIAQWEKLLGITHIDGYSVDDRRNTVIARIRGQGKLNTALIKNIVKTITGTDCKTWIEDSVLYIRLLHSTKNVREFKLESLLKEIQVKVPTHLGCDINISWQTWEDIDNNNSSWSMCRSMYTTWEDLLYDNRSKANQLDSSVLDAFYLG